MSGYEKRVAYFDLMEDGEKIGNAGFAKVIAQNGQVRLMVNIGGLHKMDVLKGELTLLQGGEDVFLDSLYLKEGRCVYSRLFTKDALDKMEVHWEDAYGICVKMGERCCLKTLWGIEKKNTEEKNSIDNSVKEDLAIEETIEKEVVETETINIASVDFANDKEIVEPIVSITTHKNNATERIQDDKWKQLEQVFPHAHPFGDYREYLSIAPKDFIVLTKEYQCLANNSFLLHGFYNYQHIILGKISSEKENTKGQEKYYLGVPGVFYEREKAVALMFGFESFECAQEPAQTGTFGYYMKRVEI